MFLRFLCILLPLVFLNVSYAVDLPPNNSWSWDHHKKMREKDRLRAVLEKQINESGSSKKITAIVETRPTSSKVGNAMMKRITSAKGNVYAALGSYAVIELIEAIGWVMEDGTYVKKLPVEGPYAVGDKDSDLYGAGSTREIACKKYSFEYGKKNNGTTLYTYKTVGIQGTPTPDATWWCYLEANKYGNVSSIRVDGKTDLENIPEPEKIPLTPILLGAAMLGHGYNDPVDPDRYNNQVNTDNWTGVPEAYTPDVSGVGNELSKELENKADKAPKTSDGKESPYSDPKYQSDLKDNDDANDRSWESGDGTEGSTDSTQTTDPETGTTTNTGTFKLPAFCDWAMTMCQWYKDWTSSDKVYKDHMTKTEEHQTEEKSFWDKVKEWFDWSKNEDGLPDRDDSELTVEPQFEEKKVHINWNAECPSPKFETVTLHGYTAQVKVQDFSFLCSLDWLIKPFTIGFASILSIFIIFGFQRGTE